MLGKLQRGCLIVDDRTNGERAVYGDEGCADMRAGITVRDALFYGRLCVRGDLVGGV